MIQYVKHKNIDKALWDTCISRSGNGLVYALSWYLDIVSPQWDALIMDDYETVMPLTWKKKLGLKYLVQPVFSQQLGVFGTEITNDLIVQFLKSIPKKFMYVKICLNSYNDIRNLKYPIKILKNYEMSLSQDYATLCKNFSKSNKNNIRVSGKKNLIIKRNSDRDLSLNLLRNFFSDLDDKRFALINKMPDKLINELCRRESCTIYNIYSPLGDLCSTAVFIHSFQRYIYLASANDETGRKNKAHFLVLDNFIRDYCNTKHILDFEGSNIESIAYIFEGFGAKSNNYYFLSYLNIPLFMRKLLAIVKK